MGNTIEHTVRPIVYGPHEMKNKVTEAKIRFLEDPTNDGKPLPKTLFRLYGEIQQINETGRREYAEQLRESLLGHIEH